MAAKSKMMDVFRAPPRETVMDRTSTNAREIVTAEAQRRKELTASLRAARLAKDEALAAEPAPKTKSRR